MRKYLYFTVIMVCLLLITGCFNFDKEISDAFEPYLIRSADIDTLVSEEYSSEKLKNGREYFYAETINFHGVYVMFNEQYKTVSGKEFSVMTSLTEMNKQNVAVQLFDSKTPNKTIGNTDYESVVKKYIEIDDYSIEKSENYLHVYYLIDNIMYSSEVDGIEVDANEFIKVIATKLQNYINSDTTKP